MKTQTRKTNFPGFRLRSGQGMVEFALALPVLLLVIYGMLETGRLIFIYGSTVTAARGAARYGSATGNNDSSIPFYRDCDGIDNEANRVAFLNTFEDINVTYDRGPSNSIPGIDSDPSADTCPDMDDNTLRNGDRIKVQVITQWSPIIAIVPSWQGFTITSEAERTILLAIPIGVDPEAEGWVPSGALVLTVTKPDNFNAPGLTLNFSYLIRNDGEVDLHSPFTLSHGPVSVTCVGVPTTLEPGDSYTCTGTYTTTQADVDTGSFNRVARVVSFETFSEVNVNVPAIQNASLALEKTATPDIALTANIPIVYTYLLTNNGNVTLSAPYTVTDNKIPSDQIDCSGTPDSIAPGGDVECTAPYVITDADINNNEVVNVAVATAMFNASVITSNSDEATVATSELRLTAIIATPDSVSLLPQTITYSYYLKNIGGVPLDGPYQIIDDRAINLSCPFSGQLSPGETIPVPCTGQYAVLQSDIDANEPIVNHAYGTSNTGVVITSNIGSASVEVIPTPALSLSITPSAALVTSPPITPATITYDYVITNTGNVSVSKPYAITDTAIPETPVCPSSPDTLAPLASVTCTVTHPVIQADLDRGSIVNAATASAYYNGTPGPSAQGTATVITHNAPRLTLKLHSTTPSTFSSSGASIMLVFELQNTGNTAVTSPAVTVASPTNAVAPTTISVSCPSTPAVLSLGQSILCTATTPYITKVSDVTSGQITINATGSATGAPSAGLATAIPFSFTCSISHGSLSVSGKIISMDITNGILSTGTVTIKTIEVRDWDNADPSSPKLTDIYLVVLPATTPKIWTGNTSSDPASFSSFTGDYTLGQGSTKTLQIEFSKNYGALTTEKIWVTFNECGSLILKSNE